MSPPEDLWSSQNHQDVGFLGSVVGGASLLLAVPAWLWRLYVDYLWKWDAHPWIASAAATFQLLAVLVIAPFALLSLLDVGAYVIARTLGVVETTRASTTDSKRARGGYTDSDGSETEMANVETPPVHADVVAGPGAQKKNVAAPGVVDVSAPSPPAASTSSASRLKSRFDANLTIPIPHARYTHFGRAMQGDGPEAEACFFSPSDERQLELSGALLSSPTPSRQASPALERRQRMQPLTADNRPQTYDTATSASSDASSTADSESFTVLEPSDLNRDGELEGDDSALNSTANLRRRGAGRDDDGAVVS